MQLIKFLWAYVHCASFRFLIDEVDQTHNFRFYLDPVLLLNLILDCHSLTS